MDLRWFVARQRRARARLRTGLKALACVAVLTVPSQLDAQVLNFKTYAGVDGLLQPQVLAMHQDRSGYLWFGTYGGLSRFNGKAFFTQTTKNGLGSNAITAITEDESGSLIVGTGGGGICFSTAKSWRCLNAVTGSPHSHVNDLLVVGAVVWVASDAGVARIGSDKTIVTDVPSDVPASGAARLARDSQGVIWAATRTGLLVFQNDRFVADTVAALRAVPITAVLPTPHGLLVGTERALFLRTASGVRRLAVPGTSAVSVTDAAIDSTGIIWVSTRNGVLRYDGERFTRLTVANGLVLDNVNRVTVDREGLVWFGTDNGASKLVPGPFALHTAAEGLPNPFVRAIVADDHGELWFGTRDGIAVREGMGFRAVDLGATLADPRIYALAPTANGGMLIGTPKGLVEFRRGRARAYGVANGLPGEFVASLLADTGGVWVGTDAGLARWVNGTVRPIVHRRMPPNLRIISMAKDARGRLWLGLRSGGVVIWDGVSATRLNKSNGLTDESIWSLQRDRDGAMWVGSNGEGAFLVTASGITRVDSHHGLVNDFVWQVLPDSHGDVWLYTTTGLDRYTAGRLRHYGRGDGLLDLEGAASAAWEESNGDLWFGSASGVTRYSRVLDVANVRAPSVNVERVLSDGREIDTTNARIKSGDGVLQVMYASPSFRDEATTRFRYRLVGTREAWSEPTSESSIRYAGLKPGAYTFEVMAMDATGMLSTTPARLSFAILPAFWQHWLFRSLVALLLAGVVAAVPVLRNRRLEAERRRLENLVAQHTGTLKERNGQLEREIAEREAAVQARERVEEKLRHAQKLEAVGRLAGGIAHDFNNLLTSVVGHAELIGYELGANHPLHPDLDEIRRAADRGASLVSQLLAFSRQQMVKRSVLDLNAIVADSTRMLQRMLGADITLDVALDPSLGCIRGDKSQIDQILVNLALNARDALTHGGTLTISTMNVDTAEPMTEDGTGDTVSGPCVLLRVSDNGEGMQASVRNRVFEPFFTTKEVGKGTGLGLSTVYGIVKQNDGHIVVDSTPGVGTTFSIYLPCVTTGEVPEVPETSAPVVTAPSELRADVVLVVEDEETVRVLVRRVLEGAGLVVLEASDGASAIAIAASHRGTIHLLLSDMIMPGLSGKEVAAAITPSRPDMRVLFMSGHTRDVLGSRGMVDADTDLLQKPFGPAELAERVRASLASPRHLEMAS
jgi:signal transduction histidine kinase/CheY-like chemotaxis protein/streptogramin lyase